jgi:hypothetical protein
MVKCQSTYDAIIKAYKNLLREGDKHSLYRFKGILYACLNVSNEPGWRKVDNLFGEEYIQDVLNYSTSSDHHQEEWFGQELAECIKKTI